MYDFQLINADTDSISICKKDGSPFTEEEEVRLLKELNSLFPETIEWDDDGTFEKIIVIRIKNYILYDGKKIKIKGSALKASTKSPALKEFINGLINYLVYNDEIKDEELVRIYNSYVKEVANIKEIKRWATRKTISEKILEGERTNESKVRDAIEGTEISEGDRCYMFYKEDNSLCLVEQFDGNYNKDRLLKNIHDTVCVFDTILDCKTLFPNYALKKNKAKLEELLNGR